jgi:hypothetical protein
MLSIKAKPPLGMCGLILNTPLALPMGIYSSRTPSRGGQVQNWAYPALGVGDGQESLAVSLLFHQQTLACVSAMLWAAEGTGALR